MTTIFNFHRRRTRPIPSNHPLGSVATAKNRSTTIGNIEPGGLGRSTQRQFQSRVVSSNGRSRRVTIGVIVCVGDHDLVHNASCGSNPIACGKSHCPGGKGDARNQSLEITLASLAGMGPGSLPGSSLPSLASGEGDWLPSWAFSVIGNDWTGDQREQSRGGHDA